MLQLTLVGCDDAQALYAKLEPAVGQSIEHDVYSENGRAAVALTVDDGFDEYEVRCDRVDESHSDFSQDDWQARSQRLAELWLTTLDASSVFVSRHYRFTRQLSSEIEKSMDRLERKIVFFTLNNPERATALKGQLEAYRKVRSWVNQFWESDTQRSD